MIAPPPGNNVDFGEGSAAEAGERSFPGVLAAFKAAYSSFPDEGKVLGEGISRDQVKFGKGSLLIDLGAGDAIHLEGFDPKDPLAAPLIDSIVFADGSVMTYADILEQGFKALALARLAVECGARTVGVVTIIERTFDGGRNRLEMEGIPVFSLVQLASNGEKVFLERRGLRF